MSNHLSTFEMPWPPSVNSYYRKVGPRMLISREGRAYRKLAMALLGREAGFGGGRIAMAITACPPDRRRRDLDNLLKCTLDSLQHAGVYDDDGQIDEVRITRGPVEPAGKLIVSIRTL